MSRLRTRRWREALDAAVPTVAEIAEEAGYSLASFDQCRNRRPPSIAITRALADALEQRAETLKQHAQRLREVADADEREER